MFTTLTQARDQSYIQDAMFITHTLSQHELN